MARITITRTPGRLVVVGHALSADEDSLLGMELQATAALHGARHVAFTNGVDELWGDEEVLHGALVARLGQRGWSP